MAEQGEENQEGEGAEALEGGSYEVIRARLVTQGAELAKRATALNERRKETFGGSELQVVGNERVRTEYNCVPVDIVQVAGHLLFSYNVFMGLKEVPKIGDVFSLQRFALEEGGHVFHEAPLESIPGLFDDPTFIKDFTELYKYTKNSRLLRLRVSDTKVLAVFQIGDDPTRDIKVFHWNVDPSGKRLIYQDNRGDREYTMPASHEIRWRETTREDQRGGAHPHVSIDERVFVETVGGDLTIKVEDNTTDGLGVYREPVDEPDQTLDDARIEWDEVGPLILLRVLPYRESKWRHFVFNERTKKVARIDAIGQACQQLPEHHGIVFPGGYYLTSGEHKQFDAKTEGLEFELRVDSPNGEDVLYVYHRRSEGLYVLLPYNLIRKEVQNPITCHGYSRFPDGKVVVFRATEEASRLHPVQIWQTPFVSLEFAASAPTDDSYLAKVGNADLVRGISEAFSLVRLINAEDPRRETYEDLIGLATRLLDNYYWVNHADAEALGAVITEIRATGELVIDEFEKVIAIRKRAREALAGARAEQEALIKSLRPDDWKDVGEFMQALTRLRTRRGHVITLRDVRSIDLPALDALEQELVAQFERVSEAVVKFLSSGEALKPIGARLDDALTRIEASDNALALEPVEQEVSEIGDGLNVLAEVVSGLQVGDAVARTQILEGISEVMSHHGRARATFQSKRKELLTREGKAEFAAQFKLFSQTVTSALGMADTPERCDEQLTALLVQLEELEGRFSEFDEFLGDLAAKREEVHDAFQARKQTLLDERQARVRNLLSAAARILEGVGRRAQAFKTADELNAYFAADAMVLKIRELVERLGELGASVKADEIASRIKSARQDALRALRDKTDLYEEGESLIKLGRHRFSVNTQVLDLTIVRHGEGMAFHLGGTDYYDPITDAAFAETRDFWEQQLVSETDAVYRGEYLAASILFAAEAGREDLSLETLYDAGRSEAGLAAVVRKWAASRYDEGYERGLHDADAALILDKLLRLWATAGLLRVAPSPRAWACLYWAFMGDEARKKTLHRRAQSVGRLRDAFAGTPAAGKLGEELGRAIAAFLEEHGVAPRPGEVAQAGAYLLEELAAERPRFATSAVARELVDALLATLDAAGKRRAFDDDMRALEGRLGERFELAQAWLAAFVRRPEAPAGGEFVIDEAAALLVTDRKLDRDVQRSPASVDVTGLLGQHPRIRERAMSLRLDEFIARLEQYLRERAPGYRAYRKLRQQLIDRERERLRLDEFKPRVLSSFVRNRLVNEVYLPLVGDNLAKQIGAAGAGKRTDQMGLLLLISPPGYGKTTLMEYIANRLGLVFMKVNGPALGHGVVSLDPAEAPNATAAQEVEKVGLSLEMGNNVMLYLDDIQHTNPEFLQKF
ncbi:MAG: DNA repair ATPase, partial [Myxococcales bacterium]|nr:DNA repair ATPase [Myxococcales bacterium]